MKQFRRAIGLQAHVLASNQDWLVAGIDDCLCLIAPSPFLGFPVVKRMDMGHGVKAVRFRRDQIFDCRLANEALVAVDVGRWQVVEDGREAVDEYAVAVQPKHCINLYQSGRPLVTVSYPLGRSPFATAGCLRYPGDAASVLLYGYLPQTGELFAWRVVVAAAEAVLVMQAIGGPGGKHCQVAAVECHDNVYFMAVSSKGQVLQVELLDIPQSWTALVPNVADVGARNEVHIEAEDEFDL